MSETFRAGVGAVVCQSPEQVLVLERIDHPHSWQYPQGGIEKGESPESAMWREVREETGLTRDDLELVREVPLWLGYELPGELRSAKTGRGQVHRWFILGTVGNVAPRIQVGAPGAEFTDWCWCTPDQAAARTVAFRRPVYSYLAAVVATLRAHD
jgi:putative (di)nucleoside polyphosphate hydrolase